MFTQRLQQQLTLLVCFGMVLPLNAIAADPSAHPVETTRDVALQANGSLIGRFVDVDGHAIGGAAVTLHQGQRAIAQTTTDASGVYQFTNMRGGQYEVTVGKTTQRFRVWPRQSAPPAAQSFATVVGPTVLVRGQSRCSGCDDSDCADCNDQQSGSNLRRNILIGAGIVALAGGIVWLVADDDDDVAVPVSP